MYGAFLHFRSGILREATMSSLRTGHSHEDVDQVFGRLAAFMVPHTAQSPRDFVDIIQSFLQQADFPFEPPAHRRAFKIDQTRDWSIDFDLVYSFVAPHSLFACVYGVG